MLQSLHPNQTLQAFVSGIFFRSLCLSLQGLGAGGCPALADALISVVLIDGTSVWGAACMELLAQRWIFHFPTPQNDISVSLAQFLNQQPPCCTPVTFRLWFWNALGCPKPYNSGFLLSSELEVGFWSQFSSFIQKKKGLVLFLSTVQKHIYCFVEVMWTSCYHCPQVWRTMFLESFVGQKWALGLAPTVRGEQRAG